MGRLTRRQQDQSGNERVRGEGTWNNREFDFCILECLLSHSFAPTVSRGMQGEEHGDFVSPESVSIPVDPGMMLFHGPCDDDHVHSNANPDDWKQGLSFLEDYGYDLAQLTPTTRITIQTDKSLTTTGGRSAPTVRCVLFQPCVGVQPSIVSAEAPDLSRGSAILSGGVVETGLLVQVLWVCEYEPGRLCCES